MKMLNVSDIEDSKFMKFNGSDNVLGDSDYFVPIWIIVVYVFFLSVGVCVNVGLALVLLCSRKNGN